MNVNVPPEESQLHETNYWFGITIIGLLFAGTAIVIQSVPLLLCAGIAMAVAGASRYDPSPPSLSNLSLERTVIGMDLASNRATVSVTIENTGDVFIPDLRIVDGVPEMVEVVEQSPRLATAIKPGESVTFEYSVSIERGNQRWNPATVIIGNWSGSVVRSGLLDCETTVRSQLQTTSASGVPLRQLTSQYSGRIRTDTGGSGQEFFATRQYQHGDSLRRINWRQLAKTGELSTIEYHAERGATVVLLIDARKEAYLAPSPTATHAVDRSVQAAGKIFASVLDSGDQAGIAIFGWSDVWFAPGSGHEHRIRGYHLLSEHSAISSVPPPRERYRDFLSDRREELLKQRVRTLHNRLPSDAQIICLSPCCDDYIMHVAHHLNAHGHLLTMISPDPTRTATPGQYLANLFREKRLRLLNENNIRVINWAANEPIDSALTRVTANSSP